VTSWLGTGKPLTFFNSVQCETVKQLTVKKENIGVPSVSTRFSIYVFLPLSCSLVRELFALFLPFTCSYSHLLLFTVYNIFSPVYTIQVTFPCFYRGTFHRMPPPLTGIAVLAEQSSQTLPPKPLEEPMSAECRTNSDLYLSTLAMGRCLKAFQFLFVIFSFITALPLIYVHTVPVSGIYSVPTCIILCFYWLYSGSNGYFLGF
jgi:hypothetical protein